MNQQIRIILASGSPYRRQLLARLGLEVETVPPGADESPEPGEAPEALVARLSRLKAATVAERTESGLVIGSDQIAVRDGTVLGKPGDPETARAQLAAASGKPVTFLTGLCITDAASGSVREHLDRTEVRFRELDATEIARYVEAEQPLDCAGSFKSEGLGISLFEKIESADPTALMGLPLIVVCRLLRAFGVRIP